MTDTNPKKKFKKQKKQEEAQIEEEDVSQETLKDDYILKPSNEKAKCDTSNWPLLLKVISSSLQQKNKLSSRIMITLTLERLITHLFHLAPLL